MSWEEVQLYIEALAKKHNDEQMMAINAKEISRERCEHKCYRVNCDQCKVFQSCDYRKFAVVATNRWLLDLYTRYAPSLDHMEDNQLYSRAFESLLLMCCMVPAVWAAVFYTNNVHCCLFSVLVAVYCCCDVLWCTAAVQLRQRSSMPREALEELVINNSSYSNLPILGGITLGAALAALSFSRTVAYHGAPAVETRDSGAQSTEAKVDGDDIKVQSTLGDITTPSINVACGSTMLTELKRKLSKDYWNVPVRSDPTSQSGSGSNNEDVAALVSSQSYYLVEVTGPKVKRIVVQLASGKLLMNKHY
jgi:hypothetical protein